MDRYILNIPKAQLAPSTSKPLAKEEHGIMENSIKTTIVYWGYIRRYTRIMEKNMETTIVYGAYHKVYKVLS